MSDSTSTNCHYIKPELRNGQSSYMDWYPLSNFGDEMVGLRVAFSSLFVFVGWTNISVIRSAMYGKSVKNLKSRQ